MHKTLMALAAFGLGTIIVVWGSDIVEKIRAFAQALGLL